MRSPVHQRRLAAVVASAVALAFVLWWCFGSEVEVGRVERRAASMEATAALERGDDPVEAPLVGAAAPGRAEGRDDEAAGALPPGLCFADLVAVCVGENGPLGSAFEVLAVARDGSIRRAAATAAVEERDVAPGGVLVIDVADACERFLAAEVVASQVAEFVAGRGPLVVEVWPSARVVVELPNAPPGEAPIDGVALLAWAIVGPERARIGVDGEPSKGFAEAAEDAVEWRILADETADEARRAEALRRCRACADFESIAGALAAPDVLLPAIARSVQPDTTRVAFERVPAGLELALRVACAAPLEHDGAPSLAHRQVQRDGRGCCIGPETLSARESRTFHVQRIATATVRGALPSGARPPTGRTSVLLALARRESVIGGDDAPLRRLWNREPEPDGRFEFTELAPGDYRFATEWLDASASVCAFERDFELRPGETLDLGLLSDMGGALDLVVRLAPFDADVLAADVDASALVTLVALARTDIAPGAAPRHVWVESGRTSRVGGLARGAWSATALAVVPRSAASGAPQDFAFTHRLGREPRADFAFDGLQVAPPSGRSAFSVPTEETVVLDVALCCAGRIALDVAVQRDLVGDGAVVEIHCVPPSGEGAFVRHLTDVETDAAGRVHLSGTVTLAVGAWSFFVRLRPIEGGPAGGEAVGFASATVEVGATRAVAVELESAATLAFDASGSRFPDQFDPLRLVELPQWRFAGFIGRHDGERVVVSGLLPNHEYLWLERVLATGGPGSIVEVP